MFQQIFDGAPVGHTDVSVLRDTRGSTTLYALVLKWPKTRIGIEVMERAPRDDEVPFFFVLDTIL